MKKLLSILVIMLFITATNAQNVKKEQLSANQIAELQTKKMELHLDLTKEQRQKIYKINLKNAEARKQKAKMRKKLKENDKKLSADERYAAQGKRLNTEIARKKELKSILTEKQITKLEALNSQKKGKKACDKKAASCAGKNKKDCAAKAASCAGKSKKACCPSKK